MALGDPYATATDLKNRLGLTQTTPAEDDRLKGAVFTATQEVDTFCNRQFNSSGTEEERAFFTSSPGVVFTDDFHTEPSVVKKVEIHGGGITATTQLVDTEYQLEPLENLRGPYGYAAPQWLIRNTSAVGWPVWPSNGHILVTATWGWANVPEAVKQATLLMAEDYYKMRDAPFGIANWGEFGAVRVQHNRRAIGLLKKFRRGGMKVG